ncbi:glycosyl hydrolase family 28-related protein [Acetobacterium sp.]|uniref:glycosyl hydrolase family 28-related protein n=1 Tax=Acetobacterium sp. TaxID=1872094 RepID=UPI00271FBB7F|nr:glycosyl hydrolase family 28-related protein [Acetobacterium sp.]MDO9491629.1 glycosyl hydrolase family 28-related protein [Acetobacterium sp.]
MGKLMISVLILAVISVSVFAFNFISPGKLDSTEKLSTNPNQIKDVLVPTDRKINAKDYGAKGDGLSDDTTALQNAIDDSSKENALLVIPESDEPYLITKQLIINKDTHISGYGAILFMAPEEDTIRNILWSNPDDTISNVSIEGLTLKSENTIAGVDYYENSMVSNVQGIYFQGVETIKINDVLMDNVYVGLKISQAGNLKNKDIKVSNLKINHSGMPIQISGTNGFSMVDSVLNSNEGGTKWLHSAYLRGDNSNFYFKNVEFNNASGGGIAIAGNPQYNNPPENMVFKDCRIKDSVVGVHINSGAKNITISGLVIEGSSLGFKINEASELNIDGVSISGSKSNEIDHGGFSIENVRQSAISNVTIDASDITESLCLLIGNIEDLRLSSFEDNNVKNIPLYSVNSTAKIKNLSIE